MRRTTGGEVSGSSSSPACSAASRNGISYMWVAWQPAHQRRYGSVISAVIRVESVPLTMGSVDDLAHRPGHRGERVEDGDAGVRQRARRR